MSGIFNIFNEQENASLSVHRGKEQSKLRSAGSLEVLPAKMSMQSLMKPKGLTVRSNSDLNVSVSNNFGVNRLSADNCMMKDKQCLTKKPISPVKLLTPKKKSFENLYNKKLSPKQIKSPIMQNCVDEFVFAKPATPKDIKKSDNHPEPEKLAYYYDPVEMLDAEIKASFAEDAKFMKSLMSDGDSIISSDEDEGFLSDPSFDSFEFSTHHQSSLTSLSDIDLPDISDFED